MQLIRIAYKGSVYINMQIFDDVGACVLVTRQNIDR